MLEEFLILSIENWFDGDEVIFQDVYSTCHRAKETNTSFFFFFLQERYIKIIDVASKSSGCKSNWNFLKIQWNGQWKVIISLKINAHINIAIMDEFLILSIENWFADNEVILQN